MRPRIEPLERRYNRLLIAYPAAWRAANGKALLGTLLDAARDGQRWPTAREAVGLLVGGLWTRTRGPRGIDSTRLIADGLQLGVVLLLLYQGLVPGLQELPTSVQALRTWSTDPYRWGLVENLGWMAVYATAAVALLRGRGRIALTALLVLLVVGGARLMALPTAPGANDRLGATEIWPYVLSIALPVAIVAWLITDPQARPRRLGFGWLAVPVALAQLEHLSSGDWSAIRGLHATLMAAAIAIAVLGRNPQPAIALAVAAWFDVVSLPIDSPWPPTVHNLPGLLFPAVVAAAATAMVGRRQPAQSTGR